MEKLNICIDIDGTITEPFFWIEEINRYFNKSVNSHKISADPVHESCEISREEFMIYYEKHGEELHEKANMREHADTYLKKISEEHNIFFITARPPRMENVTVKWFGRYDIPNTQIFFLGSHDKLEKARELDCDIFIEDRYENAIQLSEAGIHVLLIDCEYNRDLLNDYIKRVYSWNEVYEEIRNYEKVVIE